MNNFSRRKRLLNRTPARANSGPTASGRTWLRWVLRRNRAGVVTMEATGQMSNRSRLRRILRRNRAGTPAMPKMSSRRQFHRALRRHPAWPAVMELAAARARAQKAVQRDRTNVVAIVQASNRTGLRRFALPVAPSFKGLSLGTAAAAWRRKFKRNIRRNRFLVVTLLAVTGVIALMTGISLARGEWDISSTVWGDGGTLPNGRFGTATAFDSRNREILTFGGFIASSDLGVAGVYGPPIETGGETWAFKSNKHINRNPLHSPPARGHAALVDDRARRELVLFGGGEYHTNNVLGDTWVWNGQDWTEKKPPEPLPPPRQGHAMVYDRHRQEVVLYGGRNAQGNPLNDTWIWNGSTWRKAEPTGGTPPGRSGHAMAYDECNAQAVIFGGVGVPGANGVHTAHSETWTWNGQSWTKKNPVMKPTGRVGTTLAYSPASGRVVMYGGLNANESGQTTAAVDEDVWRWDGVTGEWEKMGSEAGVGSNAILVFALGDGMFRALPAPRGYAEFAYYEAGGSRGTRYHLFGGTPVEGSGSQYAYSDQMYFWEAGLANTDIPAYQVGDTPVTRRCVNKVALPPGEEDEEEEEAEEEPVHIKGVSEYGQFPLLTGTNWPADQRNTHLFSGNPRPQDPKYTPRPECPNRASENGGNTFLITDQKRNRVYQFFFCDPDTGYQNSPQNGTYNATPDQYDLLIQVHDGTTLGVIGRAVLRNVNAAPQYYETFGDKVFHDVDRGRLLVNSQYYVQAQGKTIYERLVVSQDLLEKGVDPIVSRTDVSAAPLQATSGLSKWFIHPRDGRIKVYRAYQTCVSRLPNTGVASVDQQTGDDVCTLRLAQYDVESQKDDWKDVPFVSTRCEAAIDTTTLFRNGDWIYASCPVGDYRAVVRLLAQDPNDPNSDRPVTDAGGNSWVEVYPGYSRQGLRWNDPEGQRVLFFDSLYGSTVGERIWVFDGRLARFVGLVSTSHTYQTLYGFDQKTGRLYAQWPDNAYSSSVTGKEPGALLLADTRLTPAEQGIRFRQFTALSAIPIQVLPANADAPRRVFTRHRAGTMQMYPDGTPQTFENEMFYRVLADEVPIPGETQIAELDKLTLGIPESPGKTEAFFDAEGSAYGIRLRSVGGIWSALRAPPSLATANAGEGLWFGDAGSPTVPNCVFPDRELMAGWVPAARLSDLDAVARSSGLEVDSGSKIDLTGPFSRCNPDYTPSDLAPSGRALFDTLWPLWQMVQFEGNQAAASQLAWDQHFKQVECVGDALTTYQATVGNVYGSANCVKRDGLVEATARGSATGGGPTGALATENGFAVSEGYSNVTVARDPQKGVVVTSVAVAKGIQIPGLTIDRVQTKAVAWSNGSQSDAERASFTREICGVVTPDYSNSRCLTVAEQKQFVDGWNARWTKNSQIFLPTPDPEYYKGSPGGYIIGVIKPLGENVEDELIAKDFQKEVPALVIVFYKDSQYTGFDRQALHLAATRAVAGFGVQCNTDLTYSRTAKGCVEITFENDPVEEEEFLSSDEPEFDSEGGWTSVEATGPPEAEALAVGARLGRFIETLPIIRRLPIRQMGEALLAASVWLLLGLPLYLASKRFDLNLARRS